MADRMNPYTKEQGLLSKLRQAAGDYGTLLDRAGGDPGEAYNLSEAERLKATDPERAALANRVAYGSDPLGAATSPLLAPYEALKAMEMKTSLKPLTALKNAGLSRVTLPKAEVTSKPSLTNAAASLLGPALGGGVRIARWWEGRKAKPQERGPAVDPETQAKIEAAKRAIEEEKRNPTWAQGTTLSDRPHGFYEPYE